MLSIATLYVRVQHFIYYIIFEEFDFQIFFILYIELCILTLLAYLFVIDIGLVTAQLIFLVY